MPPIFHRPPPGLQLPNREQPPRHRINGTLRGGYVLKSGTCGVEPMAQTKQNEDEHRPRVEREMTRNPLGLRSFSSPATLSDSRSHYGRTFSANSIILMEGEYEHSHHASVMSRKRVASLPAGYSTTSLRGRAKQRNCKRQRQ